jgi:hypothetical protein
VLRLVDWDDLDRREVLLSLHGIQDLYENPKTIGAACIVVA